MRRKWPQREEGSETNWDTVNQNNNLKEKEARGSREGGRRRSLLGAHNLKEGEAPGWWHIKITERALEMKETLQFSLPSEWWKAWIKWVYCLALYWRLGWSGERRNITNHAITYTWGWQLPAYLSGQTEGDSISGTRGTYLARWRYCVGGPEVAPNILRTRERKREKKKTPVEECWCRYLSKYFRSLS